MRCLLFILSLLNFFHGDKISSRDHLNSVNALSRAYFISTRLIGGLKEIGFKCQCPVSGLLHFYGTFWKPSVYAASQPHFCKQFTEYSEN